MKKLQLAILVVSLAGAMSATAQLPFVNPPETYWNPPWQGGSPYQRDIFWNFSVNPTGGPSSIGTPGALYWGTLDQDLKASDYVTFSDSVQYFTAALSPDGLAGFGITNAGSVTLTGLAQFTLGNTMNLLQKNIWVELTGVASASNQATLYIQAPGAEYLHLPGPQYSVALGYYSDKEVQSSFLQDYGYTILPNPPSEVIQFEFNVAPGEYDVINGLHIATECVPEPATFSLLALGTLALLWRRRKAKA